MKKILLIIFLMVIGISILLGGVFWFFSSYSQEIEFVAVEDSEDVLPQVDYELWELRQKQQIKEKQQEINNTVTLFAAGDIMLSRTVERKMLEKNDFSYCFSEVKKVVEKADLAIANLESPIISGEVVPTGSFSFRAHPKSAESLKYAGFDIMSLPNNHIGNYGSEGMLKTFDYLRQQNIDWVGAGENSEKLVNPLIKQVRDLRIAFLSYGYGPNYYKATAVKPGMALMDEQQLIKDLTLTREKDVDLIIVNIHDGVEYVNDPSDHQKDFAHTAIDHGADLIIGHHPHVVQKMEIYKNKYIYYSLGNFVFDQMWSLDTRQGLGITFTLTKEGVEKIDYHPVVIEDYCKPFLVEGAEAKHILDKLK
jgi:poly-gamma-glutamate capsule biosynthesis protein CapA/YwtB (metallophosphatase superfamily)